MKLKILKKTPTIYGSLINVFMDILTQRAGWLESLAAIKGLKPRSISGFISALTIAIIYFQRLRQFGETQARADAKFVTRDFEIIPLTRQIVFEALDSSLPDFEDNIQFFSAKTMQVDYIITRNKKHFNQKEIPVVTPVEFLKIIGILK